MSLLTMLSEMAAQDNTELLVLILFVFLSLSLSECTDEEIQTLLLYIVLAGMASDESSQTAES